MVTLLGMAGLAEAGEAYALMIGCAGLVLLGVVSAIGLFARSRVASGIALSLAFVLTLMFTPWEAFKSFESSDPDVHHWVAAWRGFAWWWGVATVATIPASLPAFSFSRKAAIKQQSEQPDVQGASGYQPLDTRFFER